MAWYIRLCILAQCYTMTWTQFFSDVFAVHIVKVCGISTFMRKTNQNTIIFLFVRVILKKKSFEFFLI